MEDKPLPSIPTNPSQPSSRPGNGKPKERAIRETPYAHQLATLSIEARQHRYRFIRFVLDEVNQEQGPADLEWIERNKDELIWTIEDALDDLGKNIGQGGWLVGIRRTRTLLESYDSATTNDTDDEKIRQLRELAARPYPPTPLPASKHLLLCFAPVGSRIALPEEDSGFDIIPTQTRCMFKPNVFVFPDEAEGNSFLYGSDEWTSSLLSSSSSAMPLRLVGGTFQFISVPGSPSFRAILSKVLKLTIYQHLSLLLEQHLLADANVPLTFPSPSFISASRGSSKSLGSRNRVLSHGATPEPQRPKLGEHKLSHSSDHSGRKNVKGHISKPSFNQLSNGIFSFFSKRSLGRSNSLTRGEPALPVSAPRGGSLDLRGTPAAEQEPVPDKDPRSSVDSPTTPGDTLGGRIRRFSFSSSAFSSLSPTSSRISQTPVTSPTSSTTPTQSSTYDASPAHKPFTTLLDRLLESKEMFSTSPGVGRNIDVPSLLVRLAEREQDGSPSKVRGDERVALKELLGWSEDRDENSGAGETKDAHKGVSLGAGMLGSKGFLKHQSLTTLVSVHIPAEDTSSAASSSTSVGEDSDSDDNHDKDDAAKDEVDEAIQEQQTSPSTSKAPSPETSSSSAISSLASISSIAMPSPVQKVPKQVHRKRKRRQKFGPCPNTQPPRWETFVFRRGHGSDGTAGGPCLGEMIHEWLENADQPCAADATYGNAARRADNGRVAGILKELKPEKGPEKDKVQPGDVDKDKTQSSDPENRRPITSAAPTKNGSPSATQQSIKAGVGATAGTSCKMKRGQHEVRFTHGGVRVTVVVSELKAIKDPDNSAKSNSSLGLAPTPSGSGARSTAASPTPQLSTTTRAKSDSDVTKENPGLASNEGESNDEHSSDNVPVEMWTSCAICERDNWAQGRITMSDGTFLLPFGKFLELLIYSPSLSMMDAGLCEHTHIVLSPSHARTSSLPSPPSPSSRLQTDQLSRALSDQDIDRSSSSSSTGSQSIASPSSSISSPRAFGQGLGLPSVGAVKKWSSLRNSAAYDDDERAEVPPEEDTTPTPSRIVSKKIGPEDGHSKASTSHLDGNAVTDTRGFTDGKPVPRATNSNDNSLPESRFNIVRHFSNRTHVVSFSIDRVDEIFELRVPRVQIIRGMSVLVSNHIQEASICTMGGGKEEAELDEETEKRKLRREIKVWWEGISDHVDMLENRLADETQEHHLNPKKSLPRLPSSDDAYDDFDDPYTHPSEMATPKPSGLPVETPTTPTNKQTYFTSPSHAKTPNEGAEEEESTTVTPTGTPKAKRPALPSMASKESMTSQVSFSSSVSDASMLSSSSRESNSDPTHLLSNLRQTFHRTEQSLYTQLSKTASSSLNEVRRSFLSAAKGVERRLGAWQKKHMGLGLKVVHLSSATNDKETQKQRIQTEREKAKKDTSSLSLVVVEPEWWHKSCHVAPGGNVIVKEDDWGSIIAFTLSTDAYKAELGAMSGVGSRPLSIMSESAPPGSPWPGSRPGSPPASSSSSSSFFSTTGYRLFRSSAASQPDPDQEDVIWHEPEAYSAVISRKEHPKDPSGLLSIREVLRQKAPAVMDASNAPVGIGGILSGSRIATLGREGSRFLSNALNGKDSNENRQSIASAPPSAWSKPDVQISKEAAGGEVISGLPTGDSSAAIMQGLDAATSRPASAMSGRSTEPMTNSFEAHIKRGKAPSIMSIESNSTLGPDDASAVDGSDTGRLSLASAAANKGSYLPPPPVPVKDVANISSSASPRSPFSTLTSGLTTAMRAMLHNTPDAIPRPLSAASTSSNKHHGLLSAEIAPIDERPHIKYDWTVGKRLKFSCTVYYAKQFDVLRKRCGVDDIFLRSLSKSQNWSAEGGKSKSNFWKTSDDRFIIKTLVNAWNVADLQVLIDLAPSYFRYLDSTACKATVLAKLVGFYTIEIRNLETGNVQSKADLLVMENLFYNQKIDKTFDLKGIQGRKVKPGAGSSKTLFDGEWIEGQQQTLTLVRPHSKLVLREAIRNDAEFLAKSNIMDYSLLLGVDTRSKEIACGLVDTIGSYTFAKTLEYKAKQGLSASGKEVTVVPPTEYQERFVSALERYFLACPDKWSKPLDPQTKINSDLQSLSNIL
ncbi:hypothetical protein V5O48_011743 [Marasmius crinis-equi]|uniref:PIPK domain-containing protein n=1 Tax=Marasmius crinis-equi TaxID=585013 RepID=A0ABR3F4Q8_9AGAR